MNRRIEETGKPLDAIGGYSLSPSPLSPPNPRLPLRTLATVSQSGFTPLIKSSSELRTVQGFPAYTTAMPAVTPPNLKVIGGSMTPPVSSSASSVTQQQIQRLKVEDALSYLDMVKFKFGDQPQVYNDFLDIMKEFKSQSIDTPGVIDRVSSLFNGHPELIVGFNTFLPPGYKIEVKTNEQGYSFQVQVSMPSPSASTTTIVPAVSSPTVHHTTHLPVTPAQPVTTTVVTKPLLLTSNTTIVQHSGNSAAAAAVAAAVVAQVQPVPVPATPPPSFNHSTPSITQVQAHQAVSQALSHVESNQPPTPQSQPVEFNHAINYVNKIKNRFQGQPDKYKRFLEILHTYQKEQRNLKEGAGSAVPTPGTKQLTEAEVYSQVAKLFEHQDDLLAEFGQFLPDATNHQAQLARRIEEPTVANRKPNVTVKMNPTFNTNSAPTTSTSPVAQPPVKAASTPTPPPTTTPVVTEPTNSPSVKRSPPLPIQSTPSTSTSVPNVLPTAKTKHKTSTCFRDVTLAEAAKYGTLTDFAFFDKVRKAFRSQEVYENFLRCITLYTQEVVSSNELLHIITPFLTRFPELFRWFKEYTGHADGPPVHISSTGNSPPQNVNLTCGDNMLNNIKDRSFGEQSEVDFSTCKRLGASYCALPRDNQVDKCSGRTALCHEVLNDTWVSFPTWSEESTFVTSRKTQYEEYIYRCEDERFELDLVLEVNSATIKALEGVHKKLCRLSSEEVAKFHLDDCLGGNSAAIHIKAIHRVYGEKSQDIIDGLKKNPVVAVPIVLRRLRVKEEEWREALEGFNKTWKDVNEKFYLKSLDHQGINFKQNDMKALRSKSLFNEIETCYDERHEQMESGDSSVLTGPHLTLYYRDKSILDDAANLLIHHVKRQTSNHKDKQKIKKLLRVTIPDIFYHPHQALSEDEREDEDKRTTSVSPMEIDSGPGSNNQSKSDETNKDPSDERRLPAHALSSYSNEEYTLLFGNGHWYLFLRLHQILCDRLTHIYEQSVLLAQEEAKDLEMRTEPSATALLLKPKCEFIVDIDVDRYYPTFLDMVKNVLDGNMDISNYEDTLREMFGIHAYLAFTLDKVVAYAVRQLQHLVSDESCIAVEKLFQSYRRRGGAGGPCSTAHTRVHREAAYQRKAEQILSDGENCFKMFIYKVDSRLTIELLDSEGDENEPNQRDAEKWSAYVDRFSKSATKEKEDGMDIEDELDAEQERRLWGKAIFLPRNIKLWHERVGHDKSKIPLIDSCDETECKFSLNSYKMVFVMERESYLYKNRALEKAKESHQKLSLKKSEKFHEWHQNWACSHLSSHQTDFAHKWLMGKLPDYHQNITRVLTDNPLDKPPYHPYNRFKVKY